MGVIDNVVEVAVPDDNPHQSGALRGRAGAPWGVAQVTRCIAHHLGRQPDRHDSIYRTDIEPCGFDVILMDGFLTDEVVSQVREITNDVKRRSRMVEHNQDIARQFFSYDRVESELLAILNKPRLALTFAP